MFQTKNAWKFPGGLSDPGENIGKYLSSTDWTHGKVLQMYSNRIEFRFSLSIYNGSMRLDMFSVLCELPTHSYSLNAMAHM